MSLTPGTEQLLQLFIILAGILLIPVAVALMVVLFKFAFLVHSAQEFLAFAASEITPLIQELRQMAGHLENIGQHASSGVQELGNSLHQAGPLVKKGLQRVRLGTSALFTGIGRSFEQP